MTTHPTPDEELRLAARADMKGMAHELRAAYWRRRTEVCQRLINLAYRRRTEFMQKRMLAAARGMWWVSASPNPTPWFYGRLMPWQ